MPLRSVNVELALPSSVPIRRPTRAPHAMLKGVRCDLVYVPYLHAPIIPNLPYRTMVVLPSK